MKSLKHFIGISAAIVVVGVILRMALPHASSSSPTDNNPGIISGTGSSLFDSHMTSDALHKDKKKHTTKEIVMIDTINLEKKTACVGEDVRISIKAHNPQGADNRIMYRVGMMRGKSVILRFFKPGKNMIHAMVKNDTGGVDLQKTSIMIKRCTGKIFPRLFVQLSRNRQETVNFSIKGTDSLKVPLTYHWDFGDGSESITTQPVNTHNYSLREQKSFQSSFLVTVRIKDARGKELTTRGSVSLMNIHYIASQMGNPLIPVFYNAFPKGSDLLSVSLTFNNIYNKAITLKTATIIYQNHKGQSETRKISSDTLINNTVLSSQSTTKAVLSMNTADFPADTCNAIITLTGKLDNYTASAKIYLNIPPRSGKTFPNDKTVTNKDLIEKLNKARKILGPGRPITPAELRRLEKEGRI